MDVLDKVKRDMAKMSDEERDLLFTEGLKIIYKGEYEFFEKLCGFLVKPLFEQQNQNHAEIMAKLSTLAAQLSTLDTNLAAEKKTIQDSFAALVAKINSNPDVDLPADAQAALDQLGSDIGGLHSSFTDESSTPTLTPPVPGAAAAAPAPAAPAPVLTPTSSPDLPQSVTTPGGSDEVVTDSTKS